MAVGNPADNVGVTCMLHNGVPSMSGVAVMSVQSEQEGAEHNVNPGGLLCQGERDVTANPMTCLGSVFWGYTIYINSCGALIFQSVSWGWLFECSAEINKRHSHVSVVIMEVCETEWRAVEVAFSVDPLVLNINLWRSRLARMMLGNDEINQLDLMLNCFMYYCIFWSWSILSSLSHHKGNLLFSTSQL